MIIESAKKEHWSQILELLMGVGLTRSFTGNENYTNFYVVEEPTTKKIICGFSIEQKEDIGILKSFAISPGLQGQGLGKTIVSKIKDLARKLQIKKLHATSWEAPDFWRKTIFKEVTKDEIKDDFITDYIQCLENKFPHKKDKKHFYLEI